MSVGVWHFLRIGERIYLSADPQCPRDDGVFIIQEIAGGIEGDVHRQVKARKWRKYCSIL